MIQLNGASQVTSKGLQLFYIAVPALSNIKFNFGSLQKLKISDLHNFKCLFSPSILSVFQNLESLEVENCLELEQVIGMEEIDHHLAMGTILFPRLVTLQLTDLPKLVAFCRSTGNLELSSMMEVVIRNCCAMETIFFHNNGNLELPSLEKVDILDCPAMRTFVSSLNHVPESRLSSNSQSIIEPFFNKKIGLLV
ncbi:hypothetical protein M9H77_24269 [Catharanthus roseus]|uniref:Uncharacterized protein n=1 Tax=Catharanthus roseus TaxID=4058 RepID=A0ACC0AW06_CATRO|nr:hypothetical protein M9H77_24269 [Catharanthus roseus]